MYNEQIENLINLALADGELTEKEKQVLFKKAEVAEIDLDEFEIVLDAKLFEKSKAKTEISSISAPKSDKYGEMKKCPSCNGVVNSFSTICDDCGYEFRSITANKSVLFLSQKLEDVITTYEKKSYAHIDGGSYHQENERKKEMILKQLEIIKNFPIPNTREDLLEFLYFIRAKIDLGFSSDNTVFAWRQKYKEVINRAKTSFKNDNKILNEMAIYETELKINPIMYAISYYKTTSPNFKNSINGLLVLTILGILGYFLNKH